MDLRVLHHVFFWRTLSVESTKVKSWKIGLGQQKGTWNGFIAFIFFLPVFWACGFNIYFYLLTSTTVFVLNCTFLTWTTSIHVRLSSQVFCDRTQIKRLTFNIMIFLHSAFYFFKTSGILKIKTMTHRTNVYFVWLLVEYKIYKSPELFNMCT